jgi:hypothetical protein
MEVKMDDVFASEPGLPASTVITAGNRVTFSTKISVSGALTGTLHNDTFSVFHHVENLETGARSTLAGGSISVPAPVLDPATGQLTVNIAYTSPQYTTGAASSGAQLEIPAGFDAGTFRVLTHIHADDLAIRPVVAAFHDGLVVEVI